MKQHRRFGKVPSLIALLAAALLIPVGISYADAASEPSESKEPPAGSAVAENGQLSVCGNTLCNEAGDQVQLKGMSTHGLQWHANCVNDASLDALATDWEADIVRVAMYIQEDGYETDPEGFTEMVHGYIEDVTSRGMYVLVDWHMLTPGDPNVNLEMAKTFFAEIAETHADNPGVIYEPANEPNGVEWDEIKAYHDEIVPVIRENDPDSLIILGTKDHSSLGLNHDPNGEDDIVENPVDAENIMYTFHFYAGSHGDDFIDRITRAADRLPIFVTEWGTQTSSGDGANDFAMSQKWTDLLADKNISWINWNFSDDHRSGAVFTEGTCPDGPYDGTDNLKEAGVWVRDAIKA